MLAKLMNVNCMVYIIILINFVYSQYCLKLVNLTKDYFYSLFYFCFIVIFLQILFYYSFNNRKLF